MKEKLSDLSKIKKGILLSIIVYLIWVLATYLLEGHILTLLRPEATIDRLAYTIVANMLIGILAAGWVLRRSLASGITLGDKRQSLKMIFPCKFKVTKKTAEFIFSPIFPAASPWIMLNPF